MKHQESCGICLIKFQISNNKEEKVTELVKSQIENLLKQDEDTNDESDETMIRRDMNDTCGDDEYSSDSSRDSVENEQLAREFKVFHL